jgi:hypothetical protein
MMTAPKVHGDYNASMGLVSDYLDRWTRGIVRVLGVCFPVSFFGKGRLIAIMPCVIVGVGVLWIGLTMP